MIGVGKLAGLWLLFFGFRGECVWELTPSSGWYVGTGWFEMYVGVRHMDGLGQAIELFSRRSEQVTCDQLLATEIGGRQGLT